MRTSDRVYLEIPVVIAGVDSAGKKFEETTQTLVLSRRGAKIVSRKALFPLQELKLRSLLTGIETPVRVIGEIMGDEEGGQFGVVLLEPESNVWGITFPQLDGSEVAAARVFLACADCLSQEVAHLDVFELEVLLANECLTRPCKQCKKSTLWTRSATGDEKPPAGLVSSVPRHTVQERRAPRISLKVEACLRDPAHGQEVVTTENVSRGGFRFRGNKDYPLGAVMEAALPYSRGAANIFTPVKIVYKEPLEAEKTIIYGVAYIPSPAAPSLTGLRITQPK